jgi:hypothetical protein
MMSDDLKCGKGLGFLVVPIPVRGIPFKGKDEQEAARVLCGGDAHYAGFGGWGAGG